MNSGNTVSYGTISTTDPETEPRTHGHFENVREPWNLPLVEDVQEPPTLSRPATWIVAVSGTVILIVIIMGLAVFFSMK